MVFKIVAVIKTSMMLLLMHSIANAAVFSDNFMPLNKLLGKEITLISTNLKKNELPPPYDFLLTQPVMTLGIEQYYQRRPKIEVQRFVLNNKENTYSRLITMLVDKNKPQKNVKTTEFKDNEVVVELAYININFNNLPKNIKNGVLYSKVPFGKLLAASKIKTSYENRHYFSLKCNSALENYIHCNKKSKVYGRTNTIVRQKDGKWLAQVVEILAGIKCKDQTCQRIE